MHRLKTLLTVLLVIFGTLGLAAAPRFGERPFIDIYQVPDSAMEQGHIRIKLSEANSALAQSFQYQDGALASFGLEELDALNLQYGVKKISPVFGDVSKNLKWGWRHVEWGLHLWFELEYDSEADIREIVMAYRNLAKDVQWAEPEYKKTLFSVNQGEVSAIADNLVRWTPNDPRYGEQWHYHNTGQTGGTADADIDLPEAWDIEKGHSDVVVCIQDQGVQYDHPDLAANMWINPGEIAGNGIDDDNNGYVDDVYGYNFYQSTSNIVGGDHGCHVAGTVAAVTNNGVGVSGIAGGSGTGNGVRLMSTQVFAPTSGGGGFEQAPIYAADNGACISQNSWGYTNVGSYEQSVLDAIDYFNANGGGSVMSNGITIYAAGNSQSSGQWYPGCYSGVFAVAATTHNDTKAWYSNYDTWVDVSAPGGETNSVTSQGVLSCWSGSNYGFYQGTSMACPHASGVAALVVSYAHRNGRTLSSADVEDILESTADDHYAVNQSYIGQLGSGRINAYQALLATDPTLPSVSITAPASGSVHDLNSSITITATASDTDGYITGVAFYIDDVLKSTDTSSPYSWVWNTTGYAGGAHSIKVIATDNSGNTATRSITVTLLAPPDEGFETGNFTLYPWINNSSVPWTVQSSEVFSGTYAARSGAIGNSSSTTLSLPVVVSSAGNLSFWYKVSSESNYDFLRFYVDGVKQGEWSGSAGWAEASYPLTSGSHTLAWTYSKDSSWANGSDCAWLDHIIFPPMGTYYAPPQNLTATSGNAVVNLNWQAPATGTPSSYRVYRDGSYLASTNGLNYSDTNVVNETSYEYYVTAIYGSEESDPSNTVTGFPTTNPLSTIIIGTGSETQPYPINRYWNYSSHEAIYLASQIGTACNIRYLGFHKGSGTDVSPIEAVSIYMKHTSESSLSSGDYSTDGYTLVYSGTFPNTDTSGWMEVELDNLFAYNGNSNLAILTIKGNQSYISNYPFWTYSTTTATQARQNRSDSSQPISLTASNNLPNLKLQAYVPAGLYPARNLTAFGGNGLVILNWSEPISGIPTGYKIYRNGNLLTTVTGLTYTDNAVVNGTTYSYYVVATYSSEDAEPTETVQATPDNSVIIGDGTGSNSTRDACPINVYYQSLHGQSVYTAAELNAAGVVGPINITQIGFNVTGLPALAMPNFVVRMGHTSATDVSSWISTGLTQVWSNGSYQPTSTGWNMYTLSTPFLWNGIDNIVVDTAFGLIGSYSSSGTTQYTSVTNGYRYGRSDSSDQTNVFSGGYNSSYRPNLKLALLPNQPGPVILVNPTTLAYGDVAVGSTDTKTFTIQNSGDQTLTGTITTPAGYTVAAARNSTETPLAGKDSRNSLSFSINAGATKTYNLTFAPTAATAYNGNVVITNNSINNTSVNIAVSGTGYIPPTISVDDDALYAYLQVGTEGTDSFTITNTGSQPLSFNISITELASRAGNLLQAASAQEKSIAGSTLTLDTSSYLPGTTVDWTFTATNASTDVEWLRDVIISFPAGVTVNSATNFVGGSGGDMTPDVTSGNGVTITWHGETSYGYGVIKGGESASATVNVTIGASFGGNLTLPWTLNGDIYGSEPHTLTGSNVLTQDSPPISWLSVQPLSGSIAAGQSQTITAYFSAVGMAVGTYEAMLTIHSNDPVNPTLDVSATMDVWDVSLAPEIVVSPLALDFGGVEVGTTSVLQFTVQNTGNAHLMGTISTPSGYSVSQAGAKGFVADAQSSASLAVKQAPGARYAQAEVRNTLTLSVPVGETVTYNLTFAPTAAQTYPGNVVISSNDEDEPTVNIALTGSGYLNLAAPQVTVQKSSGGVTVSWEPVTNANCYHIYRATDPYGDYGTQPFATVLAPETSWEDTQALPMAFYKVVAAFEDLPAK